MYDQLLWYTTRGAGAVSLVLLSAVVVLGLLARLRFETRGWPRFLSAAVHGDLALMTLVFLLLHIVTAVVDPFTHLGLVAAVVPFGSYYRTFWLGLGTIAFELLLAIVATSLLRRHIGARTWRAIHWLAYASWPVAVVHGIGTGTDSTSLWMIALDVVCVAAVAGRARLACLRSHRRIRLRTSAAAPRNARHSAPDDDASRCSPGPPLPTAWKVAPRTTIASARFRRSRRDLIATIERSNLRGKGGAGFPAAVKWRAVASQRGAERLSSSPTVARASRSATRIASLMERRPHLVIDGALLAAGAVGAREVVLYVGAEHTDAIRAMQRAVASAPRMSANGCASSAHRCATCRVRRRQRCISSTTGSRCRPRCRRDPSSAVSTAVQPWCRTSRRSRTSRSSHGTATPGFERREGGGASGTTLVTVGGAVPETVLIEMPQGTTIVEAVNAAGGVTASSGAVLLGGYFGGWVESSTAWGLPIDSEQLRARGYSLGCGVIAVLPGARCGVVETTRILAYLAHESARQCGPCTFGLRAIAAAAGRVAGLTSADGDLEHIQRWSGLLPGRGACRHPDGAAGLLQSALRVFADEFSRHVHERRCTATTAAAMAS